MNKRIDPIKLQYKKTAEFGLVLTLFILTFLFTASKRFDRELAQKPLGMDPIKAIEVPRTIHENRTKRPENPTLPVETEDEDIPEDATIDITDINWDLTQEPPPPPPPDGDDAKVDFVMYDKAPEIVGGYAELTKHLVYPEIARKAGVEGKVIVNIKLSKKGTILGTDVIKSLGNNGCDQAAIDAIKKVKWIPAYQRDIPVNVIIAVTVIFRLK